MARPIVTEERVFEAADQFVNAGEEPSIIAVQEHIGGGSYSTVKRYLDAWRAARTNTTPALDLPPDLVVQGQAFVQQLWVTAHALAEQRIVEVRAEAEEQVRRARVELQAAERTIVRLEAEGEDIARQMEATQQEQVQTRASLDDARTRAQIAEARVAEQAHQIGDLRWQVEEQGRELAAARPVVAEQARLSGELAALREQLASQQALFERLSSRA